MVWAMQTSRLIALDMDGTLLTPEGQVPERFWQLYDDATAQSITITPASGRQLATLQRMFPACETFIAENGAVVWHGGEVVSTTDLPLDAARNLIAALPDAPFPAHTVICAPEVATTLPLPPAIDAEVDKYYASRTTLAALGDHPTPVIKIALYVETDAERDALPWVREHAPELRAVVSGKHWLDIMHPDADKGHALEALADTLGIPLAQTAAFGDFLNDYGMLRAAGYAVAMKNAHPDLKAIADEVIGSNGDEAVVDKLVQWLK